MITVMPYERVLHYRRGAFQEILEPGRHRVWGFGHTFVRIGVRAELLATGTQTVPTSDGVAVKASAVVVWRIDDPRRWYEASGRPLDLLYDAAKEAVRVVVAEHAVDDLAAGPPAVAVPDGLIERAAALGVVVERFAVRDVVAPAGIRRAREALVEARSQALADLEEARAQTAVLRHLANVAGVLEDHPALAALKLAETAGLHGGTVVIDRPRG
ncbi:SPFH domain-containing protein [Mumia sp. DW29H23]|uniref:SPFH domain-containing protein n=1 Tax=Mumia sp. DW29H23 TaxID=3421241 RepID=UPI003D68FF14